MSGMWYFATGSSVFPETAAQWSAMTTNTVPSNQEWRRAWSMNWPIAKSVYLTAPSRPPGEGMSMRPSG